MTSKNSIVEFPEADAIKHEAALWVMRLDSHSLTSEERAELTSWLNRSPIHRATMEQMAAVWGAADLLDEYNVIDPLENEVPRIWSPSRRISALGAIAASVLIAFIIAVTQFGPDSGPIQKETFRTTVGEQKTVTLIDGSTMILNTNTAAEVSIDRGRMVRLLSGEAHFDVAKEPERPFRVYAAKGLIEAVGTAFSVHIRGDDVEVIVTDGIVEVFSQRDRTQTQAGQLAVDSVPEYRSLAALAVNEIAVIDKEIERRERLDSATLERKLMWRDGFLAFSGESLAEVVNEMSRYTDIQIEIEGASLSAMPIAGSFEAGNIQGMFDSLEKVFGIRAETETPMRVRLVRKL